MAYSETVLGAVLNVVFERLASKQVIKYFKSTKLDQSLLGKLKQLMLVAAKLLADAEQKQNSDDAVRVWLDNLKHLFYRAEEIADQIATEAKLSSMDLSPETKSFGTKVRDLIPACSSSSKFASAVNSEISEVVTQLDHMVSHSDALNLREGSLDVNTASRRETTSYFRQDDQVFGRDQEKEELLKLLSPEQAERNRLHIVAIVGMGGMGKTTLAKFAYNDDSLEAFDLKAWVYVSDHFDISRVTKSIIESITVQPYSGSLELEFLHRELSGKLKDKRFFLVLDDVWNEDCEKWDSLFTPLTVGAHGSKIIVTTRKDTVASITRTMSVIHLKPLSDADAWSLFSKHAFEVGNLITDPHIKFLGRKLVNKCQGLPLAIKTLGGLLRSKEGIDEWDAILQSTLWDLLDNKATNVVPALWLSYHYLSSQLKRCFSYCAIFPKGYRFDRKKLVLFWMAENFVKPSDSGRRMEDIGEDYLKQLLSCSFFERSGSCVIMHDLMHDLAEAVSGEFCARLEHEYQEPRISEKARYCSFHQKLYDGFSGSEGLDEANCLRTLLSLEWRLRCYMDCKVLVSMIPHFCCLHTLSISNYEGLELPDSIGNLKQLRYLDVSKTGIRRLPKSLSTLCNLQSLLLAGCSHLKRLPADMSRLVSLRHLDISETTSLREMPYHMSKLNCLQTLSGFVVGKHHGQGIEELKDLWQIRGKLALRHLQNISSPDGALDANMSGREYINELAFEFDDSYYYDYEKAQVVLENLKPHPNLEQLTVRNYPGSRFPSWLDTQLFMYKNIVNLTIKGCKNCLFLPPLGQLSSLECLEIGGMDYIVTIGSEFYAYESGIVNPFPALWKLVIRDMKLWSEWWGHEMEDRLPFPCLEELELVNCPELKGELPVNVNESSLQVLKVSGCERLESSQDSQVSASQYRALRISFHLASLTQLELKGLKELESLAPEVSMLSCLDTLCLEECENLKSLINVRLPPNLGWLRISKCKILESLPEEMKLLNNLWRLQLIECPSVKSAPEDTLPTSLEVLYVQGCERWEFPIPIELERMQCYSALHSLTLCKIGGPLVSLPLGAFPNLCTLTLFYLGELERVNIPAGVDLVNLILLRAVECPKLRIGNAEGGVVYLPAPNLVSLHIKGCELVKPLLLGGDGQGWQSKLKSLWIDEDYFKTIVKSSLHRNCRNLLTFSSLRVVGLCGHTGEDFLDKGCLLPVSITELLLYHCTNLKKLNGEALKTLTSLQHLAFFDCPNLKYLIGLPPSLAHLTIYGCPKLRYTSLDWPKINRLTGVNWTNPDFEGPQ